MITVLFFAQIREVLGVSELKLPITSDIKTVKLLREQLITRGDKWKLMLTKESLLVAVNQEMVNLDKELNDGDEVAFFPPVTGG